MDLGLAGKVILVAAASRGLGFGIADACSREGASVSVASRTAGDLAGAVDRLRGAGAASVRGYELDAADAGSIERWVTASAKDFGRIDGLVVNAGGPPPGTFESFDDRDWEQAFALTLMSAVRMIRAVLPTMKQQGSGTIVTITSSSVKEPLENLILSNVFRSGVVSLVKTLSFELAEYGIRVNNLVPGRIDTDRVRSLDQGAAARSAELVENVVARQQAAIPLGRYGTIEEFGAAGAFLLSQQSSYITGATLLVDGGKSRTVW